MAVPAVIAWKEKDNIIKLITYAFVGVAVLYTLYKLFGAFRSLGERLDKMVEGVKEGLRELGQYGLAKPITPQDTADIINKRASKNPNEPYLVEKSIYEGLKEQGKELPANVKPYDLEESMKKSPIKTERKTSTVGSKLGLWTPKEEEKKPRVIPRYVSNEEYTKIQAKRWEALAKYYPTKPIQKQEPVKKVPLPPDTRRILPIRTPIHAL